MEGLKDNSDLAAANERQLILSELGEVVACDPDRAACRAFQTGHHHQQRGLARSGGANNCDRLTCADLQVYATQNLDRTCTADERQPDVVKGDEGFCRCRHEGLRKLVSVERAIYLAI